MVTTEVEPYPFRRESVREPRPRRTTTTTSNGFYQWVKKKLARRPLELTNVRVVDYLTPKEVCERNLTKVRDQNISRRGYYLAVEVGPHDLLWPADETANTKVEMAISRHDSPEDDVVEIYTTQVRDPQLEPLEHQLRHLLYLRVHPDALRKRRSFIDVLVKYDKHDVPIRVYSVGHRTLCQRLFGL